MAQEEKPLVLRLMDRGTGNEPPRLQHRKTTGAVMIRPRRKLRMLRAYDIKFIRGPQDRSPWREEGRYEAHRQRDLIQRKEWKERTRFRCSPHGWRDSLQGRW